MSKRQFTEHALSDWMKGNGPDSEIVISSRIRIARNLESFPFPMLATNQQSKEILDTLSNVLNTDELKSIGHFEKILLNDLDELEKSVLVEKHLISPSLANESRNGAVILSENESISIMINEEDHLRIQCLYPGFQIREAWELAGKIDDIFEAHVDFAFDEDRGFLTSCPTNVGTGIRASVMMHLPALVLTQQMNRILPAITQVGLAVRGLYGEGSEAVGNLFQISNQITLGQSESEIIDNLYSVARQIIEHEKAARQKLMAESRTRLTDRIRRSYGILSYAEVMDSKEAMQRLSDVRLGIDLGLVDNVSEHVMNELIVMTQPGFLQQFFDVKLSAEDRDAHRAKLIRDKLNQH
ncbi:MULTISPECIES: protein arginine kinase [unclassified Paenibacillus]|uniref:protein arginine kinase n=1 Tax=unclassified Paenibacillus TaxID=185978 RepID=UPI001C0F9A13|nr:MULTISPECIES: protein arginine kinase [unclassified Paenibacillus]MBU5443724.1 protein arginine kinase [Paenibacillus sp. MSJ-34]CAH0120773.1 Protein-arginine kinase [Paenibacillus sp. CECT 9249]